MRTSNRGLRAVASAALVTAIVAGCGSSPASPPPATPVPTPVVTPDPHLRAPASVDDVFRLLGAAGIHIVPLTASIGTSGEPIKRITATYTDWPLVLSQYSTAEALRRVARFDPRTPPVRGEPPYNIAGMNILIEFGPRDTNAPKPVAADATRQAALVALVNALDPLIGPLSQRSVVPVPLPHPAPLPPPSATPTPTVTPTPAPTKKPVPTTKPKPTKRP